MATNKMSEDTRFMNQGALTTENTENERIAKDGVSTENTENKRIELLVDTDDSTGADTEPAE